MTTTKEDHQHLSETQNPFSSFTPPLPLSLIHTLLLKFLPQNYSKWHEGPKMCLQVSPFYLDPLKHIQVNLDSQYAVLYIILIPYLTITSIKQIICLPPLAYQPHQNSFFCYLPFVQFLLASTLGLMYNNMQLTGISFNFLVSLSFNNVLLPQPKDVDKMQMKVKSSCPNTLKNEPPGVHLILSFYIFQFHHLFQKLTYHSVFLPIFYLIYR